MTRPLLLIAVLGALVGWSWLFGFGWRRLARQFRWRRGTPTLRWHLLGNMSFNHVAYSCSMAISVSEHGLGLRPYFWMRITHPALLIPWSAVEEPILGRTLFGFDELTLRAGGERISLFYGSAREVARQLGLPRAAEPPPS